MSALPVSRFCPCGRLLHYPTTYSQDYMVRQVGRFGPLVTMPTTGGAWRISRHFLMLHGVLQQDLPVLASLYGWRQQRCLVAH
jgi:hypothetical protein